MPAIRNVINVIDPKNLPFHYCWVICVVATLGIVSSIPGQTAGVAVFTDHLMASYGLTRSQLSLAYMIGTVGSSFFLPLAGRMLDRVGASSMILLAGLGLGLSLAMLATCSVLVARWPEFSAFHTFANLGLVTLAFLGIRHFGQGQMTMISRTVLARWFQSRLGIVNGFVGVAVAFSFGIAPGALHRLIASYGWEKGLFVLGVFVVVAGLICSVFFFDSPDACGLGQEGEEEVAHRKENNYPNDDKDLPEAKSTWDFWLFNWSLVSQGLLFTGFVFHFSGLARELGMPVDDAFTIFLPIACLSSIANVFGGLLVKKVSIYLHLMLLQIGLGVGMLLVGYIHSPWAFYTVSGFLGLASGMYACLSVVAWPYFFGTKHLGRLSGYHMGWMVFGSAVGPFSVSILNHFMNSLANSLAVLVLLPLSCFVATLVTKKAIFFGGLR